MFHSGIALIASTCRHATQVNARSSLFARKRQTNECSPLCTGYYREKNGHAHPLMAGCTVRRHSCRKVFEQKIIASLPIPVQTRHCLMYHILDQTSYCSHGAALAISPQLPLFLWVTTRLILLSRCAWAKAVPRKRPVHLLHLCYPLLLSEIQL